MAENKKIKSEKIVLMLQHRLWWLISILRKKAWCEKLERLVFYQTLLWWLTWHYQLYFPFISLTATLIPTWYTELTSRVISHRSRVTRRSSSSESRPIEIITRFIIVILSPITGASFKVTHCPISAQGGCLVWLITTVIVKVTYSIRVDAHVISYQWECKKN